MISLVTSIFTAVPGVLAEYPSVSRGSPLCGCALHTPNRARLPRSRSSAFDACDPPRANVPRICIYRSAQTGREPAILCGAYEDATLAPRHHGIFVKLGPSDKLRLQ